jgi:peptidoglycan/xylan/chitin deacetylase (PgdA/CDA1 family)
MSWLGDSAALAVLSFDVDAESPILAQGRRYADHAMVMTHQAYGPLVGVPRLLRLLEEFGVTATFFVPGLTADRYPQTVETIAAAGHEVGHHSYSHRSPVDLGAQGEREDFERALAALDRVGVAPKGHRSALWEANWATPSLVAEYGLEYDSTLMDDDKPYLLETRRGTIAELPPHWSLDDWEQYAYLPRPPIGVNIESPAKVLDLWGSELEALAGEGGLMVHTSHPFLSGRASRVATLERVIERARELGGIWIASAGEIAAHVKAAIPAGEARPVVPVEIEADVYGG